MQSTSDNVAQIKLLVNTASEAVSIIKERYGAQARVVSVRQVEAEGLKRLISKPRLEVIVEVPRSAIEGERAPAPAPQESPNSAPPPPAPQGSEPRPKGALGKLYASVQGAAAPANYFSSVGEDVPVPAPRAPQAFEAQSDAPLGSAANPVRRGTGEAVQRAIEMLEALGFDRALIERARAEIDFRNIGALPAVDLYSRICDWLRNSFPNTASAPLGARRAFVGCSGVGKTAALCKTLSADSLIRGLSPTVLKIDGELPNPSDGLEVFCQIMGAELARSAEEVGETSAERPLLVDMPGFSLGDARSIEICRETLDALEVDERILVVNAAYEAETLAEMMAAGEAVGATRVVFTHLEETRRAGKLWKYLLNQRIRPLFFSVGPNPAGEYITETCSYLLERTFPNGRDVAASSGARARSRSGEQRREASFTA